MSLHLREAAEAEEPCGLSRVLVSPFSRWVPSGTLLSPLQTSFPIDHLMVGPPGLLVMLEVKQVM